MVTLTTEVEANVSFEQFLKALASATDRNSSVATKQQAVDVASRVLQELGIEAIGRLTNSRADVAQRMLGRLQPLVESCEGECKKGGEK